MNKSIVLLIVLIAITFSSCDKNNEEIKVDPFLTWKIGFDYPEDWNATYNHENMIFMCPKSCCNDSCFILIDIERRLIADKPFNDFADTIKSQYLIDSGRFDINDINFYFHTYEFDNEDLIEDFYFTVNDIRYKIICSGTSYREYKDEFREILNSIYIK